MTVEITCGECGQPFEVWPSRADTSKFCSKNCADHSKRQRVNITCGECEDLFEVKRSNTDRQYCSIECRDEAQRQRITVECLVCGGEINVAPWEAEFRTCCSYECRSIRYSNLWSGSGHYNWKGGRTNQLRYGASWPQQRNHALERASDACEICGMSKDDHKTLTGTDLHVHHVVPFRTFGIEKHEEANQLDNLIVVCRSCHTQLEPVSQNRAEGVA